MAETRNTFIKSRMNKDLDARILPKGEYRDALNVAISRSNEDTVGALENVLGNFSISDFSVKTGIISNTLAVGNSSLTAITGTNWPVGPTGPLPTTSTGIGTGATITIVGDGLGGISIADINDVGKDYQPGDKISFSSGPASGTATILYVENAICWDNLEIIGAKEDETNNRMFVFITDFVDDSIDYLSNRALNSNCLVCCYDFNSNTPYVLVRGSFLNLSKTQPIYGINIIENFLFWTDNRNQPRKINITKAIADPNYYTKEWQISIAKPAPAEPIFPLKWHDGTNQGSFMVDAVSEKLPNKSDLFAGTNNYFYDPNYKGEPEYLENKFLRFSYRFQYDDNEYSLLAPFSQACFVPKQDGFFIKYKDAAGDVTKSDSVRTYKSTEVPFMKNKINRIFLQIPALGENGWGTVKDVFHVKNLEIIVKESDGISLKKIDTISIEDVLASRTTWNLTPPANYDNWFFEYIYDGKKPFEVLPDFEVTRVGDATPIRALAQEVVGNRVVYGNFINQNTSPEGLNYTVSIQQKTDEQEIAYQNQNLKQNRTYQVGIVLQDFYGRQSSVVLSNYSNDQGKLSNIFNPYRNSIQRGVVFANNTSMWKGDCLAINWISQIPNNIPDLEGWPGIYDEVSNPLGWYSYKVVVQQQDQDYYNVYYPGALNGYINPFTKNNALDPIAHFVIHGDNINKIPRDLNAVGPEQNLFKSINVNTKAGRYETAAQWVTYNKYEHHAAYNEAGAMAVQDYRGQGEGAQVLVDKTTEITDKDQLNQIYSDEWDRIASQIRRGEGNIPDNTSTKLFHRVLNTSQLGNEQYFFGRNVLESQTPNFDTVVTIAKGQQLSLYQLPPAGTSISQANNFYSFADDPLIGRLVIGSDYTLPTDGRMGFPIGPTGISAFGMYVESPGFTGSPITPPANYMSPTLAIAETKAQVSNLDIYFETSTTGKIVELNTAINAVDTDSVTKLIDYEASRAPGASASYNTSPIGILYESSQAGAGADVTKRFIAANGTTYKNLGPTGVKLHKVVDGNNTDLTQYFGLTHSVDGVNDVFELTINNQYYPVSYGDARDNYYVTCECEGTNNVITFISFNTQVYNQRPIDDSPTTTSGAPYTANWSISNDGYNNPILTLYGNNGSSNSRKLGDTCFWKLTDPNGVINPNDFFDLKNQKQSTDPTYVNKGEISLYLKNTVTIADVGLKDFVVELSDRSFPTNQEAKFYLRITIDA